MWPFSYGGYFFPTFAYFCLLLLTFERQQKAGKRQEKEQPQKKKNSHKKKRTGKEQKKKRPGPLYKGHVFYLATNDAKTKHSAHSQINLTPVDQQGVG